MTVSHHMLRRTARTKARKLNVAHSEAIKDWGLGTTHVAKYHYAVEKTKRGPWRWRVVLRSDRK